MTTEESTKKTAKKSTKKRTYKRKTTKSPTDADKPKRKYTRKTTKKSEVTTKAKKDSPWVINDIQKHFQIMMNASIEEKKKLRKEKKYSKSKGKKLRYILQKDGTFKAAKKNDKDRIINVYYN